MARRGCAEGRAGCAEAAQRGAAEAAQVAADARLARSLQRQELEPAQEPEPQPRYTRPQARRASSAPAVIRTFPAEASSSGKAYYVLRRDQPRGVAVVAGQTKVQEILGPWFSPEAATHGAAPKGFCLLDDALNFAILIRPLDVPQDEVKIIHKE